MLRRYVEQILSLYNYIDGLMIVDANGIVEVFKTYRPDINKLKESEILGKHLLEVYPSLTKDSSRLLRVLKTGKPLFNEKQTLRTYLGDSIKAVNTTLPIRDGERIIGAVDVSRYVDTSFERQDITLELKRPSDDDRRLYTSDDIISASREMCTIKERVEMVSRTDSPILLYGETGTGKELVAQAIHSSSKRKNKRFVSQNCAAIPSNLLESILFGTVKGSYTGAENRPGLFETANGGTLFLDEINSMELSAQPKLLKAIEEKQITRVGSSTPVPVDIKIISATNEDPLSCIAQRKLREDLFYRLSVVQIEIPPLRQRKGDIKYLTQYFIDCYSQKMGRKIHGVDEEVEHIFDCYQWPGNVRELKNVIEGAFNINGSGLISRIDVPSYIFNAVEGQAGRGAQLAINFQADDFSLRDTLNQIEEQIIREAILHTKSLSQAANFLKIPKQTLNYKIEKLNIRL